MVVGVSSQPGTRRIFEDEFSAALKAAGVTAVPSYTVIPQDGQVEQSVLEQAVRDLGADGVLITRLVSREQKTQVTPGFYEPVPTMGMYGWYSSAWMGYYEPPTVYQYDVVTADTSVYSVNAGKLLWSGTTETFVPQRRQGDPRLRQDHHRGAEEGRDHLARVRRRGRMGEGEGREGADRARYESAVAVHWRRPRRTMRA